MARRLIVMERVSGVGEPRVHAAMLSILEKDQKAGWQFPPGMAELEAAAMKQLGMRFEDPTTFED